MNQHRSKNSLWAIAWDVFDGLCCVPESISDDPVIDPDSILGRAARLTNPLGWSNLLKVRLSPDEDLPE